MFLDVCIVESSRYLMRKIFGLNGRQFSVKFQIKNLAFKEWEVMHGIRFEYIVRERERVEF